MRCCNWCNGHLVPIIDAPPFITNFDIVVSINPILTHTDVVILILLRFRGPHPLQYFIIMTSAYGSFDSNSNSYGDQFAKLLPYIPFTTHIKDEKSVTIDFLRNSDDFQSVRNLLNHEIEQGMSWPFETQLSDEQFHQYFLSHTALVVRIHNNQIVGAFYCKPNFPGRCSHYCNGGFITHPLFRSQGVGFAMGKLFLRVAADLGFHAVLFNLVFGTNTASIGLWQKLGFRKLATLPAVGHLSVGVVDAFQYYYDLRDPSNDESTNTNGEQS